jgi:hypothetical protein
VKLYIRAHCVNTDHNLSTTQLEDFTPNKPHQNNEKALVVNV